jgi:hypothetical protein
MLKRLISLRTPTLTRKGFLIASTAEQCAERKKTVSQFFKHPAVLVVLGFVLTGIVGQWLTSAHEANQREHDAAEKSLDELRASYDDITTSFTRYDYSATKLIMVLEDTNAKTNEIASARDKFQQADENWREHLAVDTPNIFSRSRGLEGYSHVFLMDNMRIGTSYIDRCLDRSESQPDVGATRPLTLQCLEGSHSDDAARRLSELRKCITDFTMIVRPDPRFDFSTPYAVDAIVREQRSDEADRACQAAARDPANGQPRIPSFY